MFPLTVFMVHDSILHNNRIITIYLHAQKSMEGLIIVGRKTTQLQIEFLFHKFTAENYI